MLNIFSCTCLPSVCFLSRNVYLGLLSIFQLSLLLLLNCIDCLYKKIIYFRIVKMAEFGM